jgi:hypothetical protein
MESTARLFDFPAHLAAAPRCAQCQTKMTLERVEPNPTDEATETYVYRCADCGLIDRLSCKRE